MTKIVVLNFVDGSGQQFQATLPGFDLDTAQKLVDHMLRKQLPFQAFMGPNQPTLLDPSDWKGCSVALEER